MLFAALLVPAGFVGYLIGKHDAESGTKTVTSASTTPTIKAAPAFSADDLTKEPKDAWITNGGTLLNQRYSPLDQINTDNVSDLAGEWMTDLRGSATAAKYSAEAQPLVYDGVIYVPTGADDVFAVSVDDGSVLWEYKANLDQKISTVCCGWLSRGVALGDGKVFIGQLDGRLVPLDQKTGRVAWSTEVGSWKRGTPSPLLRSTSTAW